MVGLAHLDHVCEGVAGTVSMIVAMTSGKDVPATHDPSLPGRSRPNHEVGQSHVYIAVALLIIIVYLYQRISRDVPEMLTILSDMNEKVCLVQNG